MTKLQITELNLDNYSLSLNQQIQRQVKGGINMELFNLLEQNKGNLMAFYGDIGSNAFMLNLLVDLGSGNQIFQSPS